MKDEKAPRPLKAASIIVVEDHAFVLDLLERMLKPRVGALHGARSAEDAFYNLEKTPTLAHVAIVDYHLTGMDGLKFLEKLRTSKIELLRNLPVVIMTGDNSMDLFRSAARLGISAFLIKPVAATPLIDALEGALAGRKVAVPRLNVDPSPPSHTRPEESVEASPASEDVVQDVPQPELPPGHRSVNVKA